MDVHIRIIAIIHIIYAMAGMVIGLLVFGFGAALPFAFGSDPDTPIAMAVFGGIGLFIALLSAPGLLGGIGLLGFRPWARILILIKSAFDLLSFPFGTALAVYAFWALLHDDSADLFRRPAHRHDRYDRDYLRTGDY